MGATVFFAISMEFVKPPDCGKATMGISENKKPTEPYRTIFRATDAPLTTLEINVNLSAHSLSMEFASLSRMR
jgi:hypothetical protein